MKSEFKRFIAHKKFGQHFLIDDSVVKNIVKYSNISRADHILEIGPGPGILTKALINSEAEKITSIEIDRQFWPYLESLSSSRFNLLKKDALKISIENNFKEKVKIVANLPYNIGTKLLINWLGEILFIHSMTLMLQEEVVQRICAAPGSKAYGRLSVLLQWCCEVEALFSVPPAAFSPPPKVHSAVVKIIPRKKPLYNVSPRSLEKITQVVFHQRRKMIGTSLKQLKHPNLESIFSKVGVQSTMRPEEISVMEFCKLADMLENYLL